MIESRPATERGTTRTNWLESRHTFSFGDYHDPRHTGFGALRVINDDRVRPGAGFGMHGHSDMEIISYVLEGTLAHRDDSGGNGIIRAGEVQRVTAGRGIRHSEMNPSIVEPVHFLQIWITPERRGLDPGYEQASFPARTKRQGLQLIASREGRQGSLSVHQDIDLHATILDRGGRCRLDLMPGRRAWVQVARGAVVVAGLRLDEGGGAGFLGEPRLELESPEGDSEVLVFDLA